MSNLPTTNQASTSSLQPVAFDREISTIVAIYRNGMIREHDGYVLTKQVTEGDKQRMVSRRDLLNNALRPASMSQVDKGRASKAITELLTGWIHAGKSDAKSTVSAYVMHLQDLPAFAIERACRDVAKGYVEGLNPDFPPSAPRLHQLGMDACRALREEFADIAGLLKAETRIEKPSEEAKARVAALTEQVGRSLSVPDEQGEALIKRREESARRTREATHRAIEREYAANGEQPTYVGDLPISPTLQKLIAEQTKPTTTEAEREAG